MPAGALGRGWRQVTSHPKRHLRTPYLRNSGAGQFLRGSWSGAGGLTPHLKKPNQGCPRVHQSIHKTLPPKHPCKWISESMLSSAKNGHGHQKTSCNNGVLHKIACARRVQYAKKTQYKNKRFPRMVLSRPADILTWHPLSWQTLWARRGWTFSKMSGWLKSSRKTYGNHLKHQPYQSRDHQEHLAI